MYSIDSICIVVIIWTGKPRVGRLLSWMSLCLRWIVAEMQGVSHGAEVIEALCEPSDKA